MIIQNTLSMNQAGLPDLVAHGAAATTTRPVAPPPTQHAPPPTSTELSSAVAMLNLAMQQSNRALEFSVDSDTHRTVVRMVDTSTGELIRQFPSESVLAISRGIDQFQQGLLLQQKA